jgi:hypothetical protein
LKHIATLLDEKRIKLMKAIKIFANDLNRKVNGLIVTISPFVYTLLTGGPAILVPVVVKYCRSHIPGRNN